MEIDKPFETLQVHLFPRLEGVGTWIANHLSFLPSQTETCLTEHRGASAMLDDALDQQLELEL